MAEKKQSKKNNTGFWYVLNGNGSAAIGFQNQCYGTILIAPCADIEITIAFLKKIGSLYVSYYQQSIGHK